VVDVDGHAGHKV